MTINNWPVDRPGCRIHATYYDITGAPAKGTISFRPTTSGAIIDAANDFVLLPGAKAVDLINGMIDVVLPATDDPRYNPTGWTYEIVEQLNGGGGRRYFIAAPLNGEVALAEFSPLALSNGTITTRGATGQSAYELAVQNGFVGTVVQWIASLKGANGAAGATGPAGPTGPQGPAGDTYKLAGRNGISFGGVYHLAGSTGPEGVEAAPVGSEFRKTDGSVWRKVSGTGNTGWLEDTATVADLSERMDAVETTAAQARGYLEHTWEFDLSLGNLYSGVEGESWDMPVSGAVLARGPVIRLRDDYGTTDLTCDVQINLSGAWVSAYDGGLPKVVAGQQKGVGALPNRTNTPLDCGVRVTLPAVPPPAITSSTAVTIDGSANGGDGSLSASSSITVAAPSGGAAGKVELVQIATAYAAVITPPTGWSLIGSRVTLDPSGVGGSHMQVAIFAADWTSTLSRTFGLSPSSSACATSLLLNGVSKADLGQLVWSTYTESSGASASSPAITTGLVADKLVYGFAARLKPTADGWTQTWSGGPTGITIPPTKTAYTARGTGQSDYGCAIGSAAGVGPGVAPLAVTSTLGGGVDSASQATWISWVLAVQRAPLSHGPGRVTVTLLAQVD